jgi:hypothetical protein
MTTKAICVWLDDEMGCSADGTSNWIVSLDEIELPGGNANSTVTLDAFPADGTTEEEALETGRAEALKRGLPLYRNPAGRPAELVAPAPEGDA